MGYLDRQRHACEGEDVGPLGRRKSELSDQALEYLTAHGNVTRLLEPCVPGHADAGELGEFFSAKPWRTATTAGNEPDADGIGRLPLRAKKLGKFSSLHSVGHDYLLKRVLFIPA
jgi:hypothetical protein